MKKIISPKMHGILDYALGSMLLTLPGQLGVNNTATKNYRLLATGMTAMNAMTDTPAGLKKMIPLKMHQKADASLLAALAIATFSDTIRKDPKTLGFHLGLLGLAGLQYAMTDYDAL